MAPRTVLSIAAAAMLCGCATEIAPSGDHGRPIVWTSIEPQQPAHPPIPAAPVLAGADAPPSSFRLRPGASYEIGFGRCAQDINATPGVADDMAAAGLTLSAVCRCSGGEVEVVVAARPDVLRQAAWDVHRRSFPSDALAWVAALSREMTARCIQTLVR